MKSRNEEQQLTEGQQKAKKPRFKIEKLEERIAPHHRVDHVHGPGIHRCNPSVGRCI
ncbi:MAG: hypothetical protein ACYTG0_37385 [Planctomycetota bacterium]